jgi:hypothetical protein
MHDTLSSLVERAMMGNQKPLEYYLREQSRLPGPRANLELVNDLSYLLATLVTAQPANVQAVLKSLIQDDSDTDVSDTFRSADVRPLDIGEMGVLEYDITKYQPILYAAESIDHLLEVVGGFFESCDDDSPARYRAMSAA